MPKLYNIYSESHVRVWLKFVAGRDDFCIEDCTRNYIGKHPVWLSEELSMAGWEGILDFPHKTTESGLGWLFDVTQMTWMLNNGIAPGQPFQVQVNAPIFTTDYYGDHDAEIYWDIVQILPIKQKTALKRWDKELKEIEEDRAEACKKMQELIDKRHNDISAMHIRYDYYWAHGYCDMSMPDGVAVKLCSSHTSVRGSMKFASPELAVGRNDDGNKEKAWLELLNNVKEKLPHFSEEQIRGLKVKI